MQQFIQINYLEVYLNPTDYSLRIWISMNSNILSGSKNVVLVLLERCGIDWLISIKMEQVFVIPNTAAY